MNLRFKTLLSIISMQIAFLTCHIDKNFSTPIDSLETLRKSIYKENWQVAALCFTEGIRAKNQNSIYKKKYCYESGTVQSLF